MNPERSRQSMNPGGHVEGPVWDIVDEHGSPCRAGRGEIFAVCSNHDDSAGPVASSVAEVQQQLLDEYGIDLLPRETVDDLDLTSRPQVCAR